MASHGIAKTEYGTYKAWFRFDDGSQHARTFKTRPEAREYRDQVLGDIAAGKWASPRCGKVTFDTWADEWWDTWSADPDRSPTALQAAESRLRLHLRPFFGRKQLRSVNPTMVRRWQDELKAKLGHESIMACRSLLYRILQAAMDDQPPRITANPVAKVPAPKRKIDPTVALGLAKRRTITPEEFGHLLAAARPFWRDHLLTLVGTGLRAGELCGLPARRVDLAAGVLYVVEARYDAGKWGHGQKASPKTQAGIRPVPLAEPVAEAIRHNLPPSPTADALAFSGPGGASGVRVGARTALDRYGLRRVYLNAVGKAREDGRLKHLDLHGPHDLRHTFATWLEDAGIPSRVIDELMGHESGRRTREGSAIGPRYRHTTDAMLTRVRAAIGDRLTIAAKVASDLLPDGPS